MSANSYALPRFAPGWALTAFVGFFLPILLLLGFWQLDRAEEKRLLQARMDQSRSAVAVPLDALQGSDDVAWRPVQMQGIFDPELIWFLDNRTRDGNAGLEVLQVFIDADSGKRLIVNRGWLAWPDRRQVPNVRTPRGSQRLDAEALPPTETGFTMGTTNVVPGWPKLITRVDMDAMREASGETLLPWMARLRTGSDAALTLDWPKLPMTSSKHTAYAVQWFALALALLALFLWAGLRPDTPEKNKNA
jgi:cytochrome oxidase assembly protein ShyY1